MALFGMQADLDRVLFDEATILRRLDEFACRFPQTIATAN